MNWILLAILTAFLYGAYNFFIKVSSSHINQIVGAVILQIVAALVGAGILIFLKLTNAPLEISSKGVGYAVVAGVMVGLAEIASFFLFSKGVSASVGIPIIIGGSVIVGAVLGLTFLKESFGLLQLLGLVLIVAGIAILTSKMGN